MRLGRLVLLAAGAALLCGCGQKGPLYLPDKGGAVVTPPVPAGTAPAQSAPAPQDTSATPPKKTDKDQDPQMPR